VLPVCCKLLELLVVGLQLSWAQCRFMLLLLLLFLLLLPLPPWWQTGWLLHL
jgi:hypothetical protein